MTSSELRQKYLKFFENKGHKVIPSAPLIPENDSSTLFISAGMQPLSPYLLGQSHPQGKRLVNSQKCIRTGDIDEVGDTYHHTFFEMLGNWSLGDYFKEDSIKWSFEFLTKELGISLDRIKVSVFAGDEEAPRDQESAQIWKSLGVPEDKILYLGKEDNWWAAGTSGPCGPDTEIFVDGIEIWNNVFMMFNRKEDGSLAELPNKNVDTGMGLERALAVLNGLDDNYQTDLWLPLIKLNESHSGFTYNPEYPEIIKAHRIIADHIKAATFLINDGVLPSNKGQGYVLRRLIRRAVIKCSHQKKGLGITPDILPWKVSAIFRIYKETDYFKNSDENQISKIIGDEIKRFEHTRSLGLKEFEKHSTITGKIAFDLYQSYGFPLEVTRELALEKGQKINEEEFKKEYEKHQQKSRTASLGMFKGGLAGTGEMETKYHTTTHLLHAALRQILGETVSQQGSNITPERLRFDFSYPEKLTDSQIKQVEDLVNEQIKQTFDVEVEMMDKQSALDTGALAFFPDRYPDQVTVYSVGDFSKEICMGPHVKNTGELGTFKITKEESVSAGVRRIYADLTA